MFLSPFRESVLQDSLQLPELLAPKGVRRGLRDSLSVGVNTSSVTVMMELGLRQQPGCCSQPTVFRHKFHHFVTSRGYHPVIIAISLS